MFTILVLAALCCCLCLCIPQAVRLPYRDVVQHHIAFQVLTLELPKERGPPSFSDERWSIQRTRCAPVSVANGENRDGGRAPDGSLEPQGL